MKKDLSVETLKGLACILLVAYHVIGSNSNQGIRVPNDSYLRYINESLLYIRMPLFTFLSGFVYALRPVGVSVALSFLAKKARRLMVPMLVVGTIYIVVQSMVAGTNKSHSLITLFSLLPVAHFWFVESLFVLFLVIVPLELSGVLKHRGGFAVVFLVACVLYVLPFMPTPFLSMNGTVYLAPFFLTGVAIHRFSLDTLPAASKYTVAACAFVFLVISQLNLNGILNMELGKQTAIGLAIGITICPTLYFFRFSNKWLGRIGYYSYSIYLFHVFGTAGARIILERLGMHVTELHALVGLVAGITMPMLLEFLLARYHLPALLFFGKSAKQR